MINAQRQPTLWAFFLPQEMSYERVAPFCAGDFVGWGTENRLVPIRKIKTSHWEVRSIDATANMYLTLAAVLSAGLLGLAENVPLKWPDLSMGDWPDMTLDEIRAQAEPLPRSLNDSLSVLGSDFGGPDTMLNKRMVQHYVDLKRYELSRVEKMGPEKTRNLLIELF
ncbi:glutamine synthetase/guanido kinase [Penicillium sp. DV-2018c]|nr:glutamine synthetase/guanido kinase [Penicillium sp. DV-2018c]KAJ5563589.1 glutamine synthetase/guanido kinase [Penicillium sp. DV-2018c]